MNKKEQLSYAKAILADGGIKVFKKDIKSFYQQILKSVIHIGDGTMVHKEMDTVVMNDGTLYKVLRETIDKDGNYSTHSALMKTTQVTKYKNQQFIVI